MDSLRYDTAILLFSRSAAGESIAKPLVTNGAKRTVATHLIRHALRVARQSGMPVIVITDTRQQGDNFGERFANAFEQLFARGYQRVISIGNDCPALTANDLVSAATYLDTSDCVIGPASDGGAYLVGMRREVYRRAAFMHIPWQTAGVFEALIDFAAGDYTSLDEKSDVDSPADLRRVLRADKLPVLLKIKLSVSLKRYFPDVFYWVNTAVEFFFANGRSLRGPPRLAGI